MTKIQEFCIAVFFCLYLTTLSAMPLTKEDINLYTLDFARKMYRTLSKKDGNVLFSPISTHIGLSMLLQGAAGSTASQMGLVLGVPDNQAIASYYKELLDQLNLPQTGATLHLANKIYIRDDYTIKPTFQNVVSNLYLSPAQSLQFKNKQAAANTINDWIASTTNNNITNIVSPDDLDDSTKMVLVNAINLKTDFHYNFNKKNTKTGPFWISNTEKVDVPMMYTIDTLLHYLEVPELNARIVEIPLLYVGHHKSLTLHIVLPNNREGIKGLEREFTWNLTEYQFDRSTLREVNLFIPKFKLDVERELKEVLKEMEMRRMFEDNADFQNLIEGKEGLKLSKIVQKASFEVNEDGVQTGPVGDFVGPQLFKLIEEPTDFIVDHPALFFITYWGHSDHDILYMGRLQNPTN